MKRWLRLGVPGLGLSRAEAWLDDEIKFLVACTGGNPPFHPSNAELLFLYYFLYRLSTRASKVLIGTLVIFWALLWFRLRYGRRE